MADAGVATVNVAVDAWDVSPACRRPGADPFLNFDYLVKKQYKYGYLGISATSTSATTTWTMCDS